MGHAQRQTLIAAFGTPALPIAAVIGVGTVTMTGSFSSEVSDFPGTIRIPTTTIIHTAITRIATPHTLTVATRPTAMKFIKVIRFTPMKARTIAAATMTGGDLIAAVGTSIQ
ncbi:MAG: hypothetical protein QOH39_2802 [Verrucomicrobiota bacterium]